jgi:UDP-glucose 4-epimerase
MTLVKETLGHPFGGQKVSQKCLVTGIGGFIGRNLATQLIAGGHYVAGLDVNCAGAICDRLHNVDITNPLSIAPFEGVGTVFHLAGKVHALSEVIQEDSEYFRINTEGTRNVLEAARRAGVRRFILFSTVKAMSRDEDHMCVRKAGAREEWLAERRPWKEEDGIEPDTPYGRSKLEAERLVLHGGFIPEPVVLRLCMVYGPRAKGNMQKMLAAVSQHRFPPLPEVGNRRSMVHVSDVIQAAVLAAIHPAAVGEVFIVSDGHTYSTRQMYDLMWRALDRKPSKCSIPLWCLRGLGLVGDGISRLRGRRFAFDSDALEKLIGSAWFSSKKIEERLGFKPEWDLEKALPEMIAELKRTSGER